MQCMRQPPHFGRCANSGMTAWTQCCALDARANMLRNLMFERRQQCTAAAASRVNRERQDKNESEENRRIAERLKKANDWTEQFSTAKEIWSNPTKFFTEALKPNSPLSKMLFKRDSGEVRADLGEELYRYLQTGATGSVASNPVIAKIQKSSLDELSRYHQALTNDLYTSLNAMKKIGSDNESSSSSVFTPASRPKSAYNRTDVQYSELKHSSPDECSVLRDVTASRNLMTSDRQKWLELSDRCDRK